MLSIRGNILELFGNLKNSWLKKKKWFWYYGEAKARMYCFRKNERRRIVNSMYKHILRRFASLGAKIYVSNKQVIKINFLVFVCLFLVRRELIVI